MLWKLKIPGYIKHFLWKVCYDILPIKLNLYKRLVLKNPTYPICNKEDEIVIHALWACLAASDVWGDTSFKRKWPNIAPSFWQLWTKMVDKLPPQELELSVTIFEQLWSRRSLMVFEEKFESPCIILQRAKTLLKTYQISQTSKVPASFRSINNPIDLNGSLQELTK